MPKRLNSPGVYVEEVSIGSQISTLVGCPIFFGFTELGIKKNVSLFQKDFLIKSFDEYEKYFGHAFKQSYQIKFTYDEKIDQTEVDSNPKALGPRFVLRESIRLYFLNGGGPCYIVSVGNFTNKFNHLAFQKALNNIQYGNHHSLLLFPEASFLPIDDYGKVIKAALKICNRKQYLFLLTDLKNTSNTSDFRSVIGADFLQYAAAFVPNINSKLSLSLHNEKSQIIHVDPKGNYLKHDGKKLSDETLPKDWVKLIRTNCSIGPLPVSPIIAGIISHIDQNANFWSGPASIPLNGINSLCEAINNNIQETVLMDSVSGKHINPIRTFPSKGTLLWGIRTLAGNDNEWRYIPISRSIQIIEKSIYQGLEFVVFEPNDANTWLKVKTVVSNYLSNLWRNGALQGTKPEQAFFVKVGLNQTMTQKDLENNLFIIEVGLSMLKPAEFVLLKMSIKGQ